MTLCLVSGSLIMASLKPNCTASRWKMAVLWLIALRLSVSRQVYQHLTERIHVTHSYLPWLRQHLQQYSICDSQVCYNQHTVCRTPYTFYWVTFWWLWKIFLLRFLWVFPVKTKKRITEKFISPKMRHTASSQHNRRKCIFIFILVTLLLYTRVGQNWCGLRHSTFNK
jgi:hypothetical protein